MGGILLAIAILGAALVSLARPWVGICAYYLLAVLGPQYIWWWHFEGLRVSFIVALCTIAGLCLKFLKGELSWGFLGTKQNLWVASLWFFLVVSYYLGSYSGTFGETRTPYMFSMVNAIFFFYFCASVEIDSIRKLDFLALIFAFSTIYLAYWANIQYFSGNWDQFEMGRLRGPSTLHGKGIYSDQNAFAMLFVTGLPFVYYIGSFFKKKWLRLFIWLIVPFVWHAIFLTGSRGGLLGVSVVVFLMFLFSNKKLFAVPLIFIFLIFYQWQAGDVMENRSNAIVNIENENSAGDRLNAWKGGMRMVVAHPLTGVGLGNFVSAVPDFVESRKMMAHNTFVQFTAESGVGAGLAYLVVIILFLKNTRKIKKWCTSHQNELNVTKINIYNLASTTSFGGLIICSIFLSLNNYEIFFVLILFNNTLATLCNDHKIEKFSGV